jgi:general secretion pathway protein B
MSYILDALKKAEAERRQEQVPGLDAQPIAASPDSRRGPPWLWPTLTGGATALAALIAITWWQPWRTTPAPAPHAMQAAPVAPAAPAAAPAAAATPAAPATQPARTPAPVPAAAATAIAEADTPKPSAPVAKAPPKAAKPKAKPAQAKAPRESEATPPAATASARPAPAEESIPALRELPEALQRTIPPITVGGYIYAARPADRSVLINKRLVRDGDQISPGLTLEKMTPNSMVFNYNGTRFRTSY